MPMTLKSTTGLATLFGSVLLASMTMADEPSLVDGHPQPDKKQATEKNPDKKQVTEKSSAEKDAEENADKNLAKKREASKARKSPSDARPDAERPKAANKKSERAPDDREQAALALVREHHPDLVDLLKRLQATKRKEYQRAVKELYRDSQRLENVRQRDPERYGLDLRAWQLDSRIRLLTAKLSLEDRPELEDELKAALGERADVRLAQKELERNRTAARLKKLEEDISSLTARRDEELQRTFDRLLRSAVKARPAKEASGVRRQSREEASGDRPNKASGVRHQASGASKESPSVENTSRANP
jgi:hypothetical protein